MSSGQKALEEELEVEAYKAHYDRVAQLGPTKICEVTDRMNEHVEELERELTALSRRGWWRLDELKKELKKLS